MRRAALRSSSSRLPRRAAARLLAAALLCAAAACGCGNRGSGRPGDITLHIADWGGASADPAMAHFQAMVDTEWRRRHPHIHIVEEHIPGSQEYVSKMLAEFVAGTQPDLMVLDASSAAAFIDNDTLLDLAPLAARDHLDLSVYYPNVLSLARRGSHLYALPADFTPMMIYYNRRMFQRAGIPYPCDGWQWSQFRNDCQRLTLRSRAASQPTQYGFLAQNWMPGWIPWIWQNGGDVLSPDGRRAEGYLDSQSTEQAVSFFAGLVRDGLAPSLSAAQAQGADPFQSGLCAMEASGHWNLVSLKASETIRMSDVGVVGMPRNRFRVTALYESGYAVTRACRHKEAAWEYARFLSGPFVQRAKAALGIGISANRQVAESRRAVSALEPEFLANVRFGRAPWGARVEDYAQVEDIGQEMMDEVLLGVSTPSAALRRAARRVDAELSADE